MDGSTVQIATGMVLGVEARPIAVEATARHSGDGTPRILGLADPGVREAYHRVLQAFSALSLPAPRGVTTVNLAPASLRKTGSGFDLPLALALAGAGGLFEPGRTRGVAAYAEVSLGGLLLSARGAVSVAALARERGLSTFLCSPEDAPACAAVGGLRVLGPRTLADALYWITGQRDLDAAAPRPRRSAAPGPDLADLCGLETPKLALAVAAAGEHNLLFVGPPGTGKSALLHRLPGILPPPPESLLLEIGKIHAAAGLAAPDWRPFRAPHHTSSTASLIGGGPELRPGEVSLAHGGILFLDELPEFHRDALECLRQPLEDGRVTVGRALRTVSMPAGFVLAAAMNPCPCGYLGHPSRPCVCPPPAVHRYRSRVSGPLLDRIDLQVEVPPIDPASYGGSVEPEWATPAMRARVLEACRRQRERNCQGTSFVPNGRLQDSLLERCCALAPSGRRLLERILRAHGLGGRARVRMMRIARTLADLAGRDAVEEGDLLEAAALRGFASGARS
ncbi:MAG: YifB family Mg chelatase-like AAA ATPase [Planctomycetota bacterium]